MSLNDQYCFQNSLRTVFYAGLTASLPVLLVLILFLLNLIFLFNISSHQINNYFFFFSCSNHGLLLLNFKATEGDMLKFSFLLVSIVKISLFKKLEFGLLHFLNVSFRGCMFLHSSITEASFMWAGEMEVFITKLEK